MCETVGYWMWLGDKFKSLGYLLKKNILRIPSVFSHPALEFVIGYAACIIILIVTFTEQNLTLVQRTSFALLFIPSFLLITHGLYRDRIDC